MILQEGDKNRRELGRISCRSGIAAKLLVAGRAYLARSFLAADLLSIF
jgi:hypothetical protein